MSLSSLEVPGLVPGKQTLIGTILLPYLPRVLAPAKKELLLIYLSQSFIPCRLCDPGCSRKAPGKEAGSRWSLTSDFSWPWFEAALRLPAPVPVCGALQRAPLSCVQRLPQRTCWKGFWLRTQRAKAQSATVNESLKQLWVWREMFLLMKDLLPDSDGSLSLAPGPAFRKIGAVWRKTQYQPSLCLAPARQCD